MFYLYIIFSDATDKFYVGISEHPQQRLVEHNSSERNTFTAKNRPWRMVALFECAENLGDALKIERFIKKQKSRNLILKLVKGEQLDGVLAQLVRVPHLRD